MPLCQKKHLSNINFSDLPNVRFYLYVEGLFSHKYTIVCFLHTDWCYQSQMSCDQPCKGSNREVSFVDYFLYTVDSYNFYHLKTSLLCAGPAAWNEVNVVCDGNKQSPINIVTKKTKQDASLTAFKFTGYSGMFTSILKNNGQTGTPGLYIHFMYFRVIINRNGETYGKQVGTFETDRYVGSPEKETGWDVSHVLPISTRDFSGLSSFFCSGSNCSAFSKCS